MCRCARESGDQNSVRPIPGLSVDRAADSLQFTPRQKVQPNQGGRLRGVVPNVRSATIDGSDAPSRAAVKGVFHEFRTAAIWAFRLGSARSLQCRSRRPLESRQLLATGMGATYLSPWLPTAAFVTNPITKEREIYLSTEAINPNNPNSPGLINEGKVVTGVDRAGDQWTITVHGPGYVVVTDTTPNDGALDDDINTIQLVDTSLKSTYVTGNVFASNKLPDIFAGGSLEPSNGENHFQPAHRHFRA